MSDQLTRCDNELIDCTMLGAQERKKEGRETIKSLRREHHADKARFTDAEAKWRWHPPVGAVYTDL